MELNCMIVDDEPLSRELLKHFIQKTDFLTLTNECENGIKAANFLQKKDSEVDIVYLDEEMPEMTGMEILNALEYRPEIIMTTSSQEKAVEAFEAKVTDYIVKPYDYSRFLKASIRAKDNIELLQKRNERFNDVFIKSNNKIHRIPFSDIKYVEALADYVIFNTVSKGKLIVHYTMKGIEKRLPSSQFSRVHRSFIVNINQIDVLEDITVVIEDKIIPIGASYKESFFQKLNFL
ncbi:MAG: LytTR family DNA-binding domain-containing protein [Bacteroidota bacterium]